MSEHRKRLGQFFTPPEVAKALVSWLGLTATDRMLDPSCGDGQFLRCHKRSVGIEVDPENAALARLRAPGALVHGGDFFSWANNTKERFEAVAGNPPFIRYQLFMGDTRQLAIESAQRLGAAFSGLASSWPLFLVVASGLLKPGGRMAFVVPAELGHASYARPLIRALCGMFERVHVVACREKLFPQLSEDCWILHCSGYGGHTTEIALTTMDTFGAPAAVPRATRRVPLTEWEAMGARLRPFLLGSDAIALYQSLAGTADIPRLGAVASANIGYVSGANDFFHLRPSEVKRREIPKKFLRPAVRKSSQLPEEVVERKTVQTWRDQDAPFLLLDLAGKGNLPASVWEYLDQEQAHEVKAGYKCRQRDPWYAVPDVVVPDAFLSVMCGERPSLVRNEARCVCTNTLHAVRLKPGVELLRLQMGWNTSLAQLGAEIEGHPLGGGMLKLEPREAARVPVPMKPLNLSRADIETVHNAVTTLRRWRHNA